MQVICPYCHQPVLPHERLSGVQWKNHYYEGHYACVVQQLGSDALLAMRRGLLPFLTEEEEPRLEKDDTTD